MGTIEDLRKKAKLNFCDRCFQEYKALIEPTIEYLLRFPFADWRQVESEVTQMVMKKKGIFKGKEFVYNLSESVDGKYADCVDDKALRANKKTLNSFYYKIVYLRDEGILKESSFKLLYDAKEIRNRMHNISGFSEQDYTLFGVAHAITNQIWFAMMAERKDELSTCISNAEKIAEQYLKSKEETQKKA
jgi:hypothetical protein